MTGEKKLQIAFFLSLLLFSSPVAATAATGSSAPVNGEFLRYVDRLLRQGRYASEESHPLGESPSPVDISHLRGSDLLPAFPAASAFPSAYDLRGRGEMTAVRDQSPYGTCWAFGAIGSLESTFLKGRGEALDFSEWHLAYFRSVDESESLPAFDTDDDPSFGGDSIFDQGGNAWKSTALLARWTGAVAEVARPYQNVTPWDRQTVPLSSDAVEGRLEEVYLLGEAFEEAAVKAALTEYGALVFSMEWTNDAYNGETDSYYCPERLYHSGHSVVLAGWDDVYPAANFRADPGRDGAWLVKNSWGAESFGDEGYFWISYADGTLRNPALFVGGPAESFDALYQHDPLGWIESWGFASETAWMSNVFGARGIVESDDVVVESLEALSLYALAAGTSYRVEVWTGGDADVPRSGERIAMQEGLLDLPGYRMIRFDEPPYLAPGRPFAVVARVTTPGYVFPIAVESPLEGYSGKARADRGESYVSSDGATWQDLSVARADSNVCLKAFTKAAFLPGAAVAPLLPDGDEVRSESGAELLSAEATARRVRQNADVLTFLDEGRVLRLAAVDFGGTARDLTLSVEGTVVSALSLHYEGAASLTPLVAQIGGEGGDAFSLSLPGPQIEDLGSGSLTVRFHADRSATVLLDGRDLVEEGLASFVFDGRSRYMELTFCDGDGLSPDDLAGALFIVQARPSGSGGCRFFSVPSVALLLLPALALLRKR